MVRIFFMSQRVPSWDQGQTDVAAQHPDVVKRLSVQLAEVRDSVAGKSEDEAIGFMHWDIGGYKPDDIDVVAAFDIDRRKVGKDLSEAIFQKPNCTKTICEEIPPRGVRVKMGRILDSIAPHMNSYEEQYTFLPSEQN